MREQSESDARRYRAGNQAMKLLVIDNYDSFTYNLVQLFGEMEDVDLVVKRNDDQVSIGEIESMSPDHIVISPGPCTPSEAGLSCQIIEACGPNTPVLGVCLGHQCIAQAFGGEIVRAEKLMHGKTSQIHHQSRGVFKDLAEPLEATRYHSLIVKRESVPDSLEITAKTDDGEIMGLQHREFPIHGVQFHPESILTTEGRKLLANFLRV